MNTLEGIQLPSLQWHHTDYCAISQKVTASITGHRVIQRGRMAEGRPITLDGAADRSWLSLERVNQLSELRYQDNALRLVFNGAEYKVKFALDQADHLVIRKVMGETYFVERIKLIEVLS
ncbi:hypothetical protein L1285_16860 [Pseudoalteromonas sp. DL2-H2.2]|uniref:hypothetical protein n=1 Tax=Pseudoalteromonas sp. DL2-H2.2 TaxID=2908889 RepID=UPI001F188C30|nr:hypothetical protein [Pseudoalteromonas sp. DL2-H2.2]MCF2909993.1 hypothetical protein [Pseudoalteromonas sp. DL2-H2.2]